MTTRRALRVLLKAGHQVERSSISTAYVVDGRLCSQQRLRELAVAHPLRAENATLDPS